MSTSNIERSPDLVSKLRADAYEWNEADPGTATLERDAADEIERLRAENARLAALAMERAR